MEFDLRCQRCHRPYRGRGEWQFTMKGGVVTVAICPNCQGHEQTEPLSDDDGTPAE